MATHARDKYPDNFVCYNIKNMHVALGNFVYSVQESLNLAILSSGPIYKSNAAHNISSIDTYEARLLSSVTPQPSACGLG
jgi:hypothetical protein